MSTSEANGPAPSRRIARWFGASVLLGALLVLVANVVVVSRTADRVVRGVGELRPAEVVIVPGSAVRPDGTLGDVVEQRLDAAVGLYEAGLVEKVLLSGDNGERDYNEPDAMRRAALDAGVAPEDLFTDYAGFSTWHTMRRARDVFEVSTAVVVTQSTYAARSVDLARAAGIDAQGYVAGEGGRSLREALARVRGLVEATWRPQVTPGPPIPISGDGRDSWAGE